MSEYEFVKINGKKRPVHVVLMEQVLGRPLEKNEVVHHINGDKRDNSLENLQVMDRGEHTRMHTSGVSPTPEMIDKLRNALKGRPAHNRKFSREQVRVIAERLKKGEHLTVIAREYDCNFTSISKIRDGKAYRDYLEDYPEEAFPLQKHKFHRPKESILAQRRFSTEEAMEIKGWIQKGYSDSFIAKQIGAVRGAVREIRLGNTYQDVPWPEKERELLHPDTLPDLTFILLKYPMSEKEDEFSALRDDYHLTPSILAITMLRLVRRALAGDRDLALCLLVLGGYENMVGRILMEESALAPLMK